VRAISQGLSTNLRKGYNVGDIVDAKRRHHEPVDAKRDARTLGHTGGKRSKQRFV
jgi:hypothetical protein